MALYDESDVKTFLYGKGEDPMQQLWNDFESRLKKLKTIRYASSIMEWDAQTGAPKSGMEPRAEALGYMSELYYGIMAAKESGEQLAALELKKDQLNELQLAMLKKFKREYDSVTKIPENEYIEFTMLVSKASNVWEDAKKDSDFALFAPYLEQIVDFIRKFADYRGYTDHPYNTFLDDYEPGMTVAKLDVFFDQLRKGIVPLVKAISEKGNAIRTDFLQREFPIEQQKAYSKYLLDHMGFNLEKGMIAESVHPFMMGIDPDDIRLTSRYYIDNVVSSLFSTAHEGGHAIYEQNCDKAITGFYMAEGVSSGIHESQSRLYENSFIRSRSFWEGHYDVFRTFFPEQTADVTFDEFFRAVNASSRTLIRIESDELTYSLHIMLRYEIEKGLMEKTIKVSDLPELWNRKMEEYLGITPPNDGVGVLQDTHWSCGLFGYFPTYALGNAYAAQVLQAMNKDLDVEGALKKGDFNSLKGWLGERIHKYGSVKTPDELMVIATGETLNPDYYVKYLQDKFTALYDL